MEPVQLLRRLNVDREAGARSPQTPVFVVTGDTSEQSRLRALKLRSLLLLTKPVPLAMLKSLVETSLKKSAERASTTSRPPKKP